MWTKYVFGKQTYGQLAKQKKVTIQTIQNRLDQFLVSKRKKKSRKRKVVAVMDTTYFGKGFGVMVFRDEYTKENLLWNYCKYETIALYQEGIRKLETLGYEIVGIVCDGRRGLFKGFPGIPVQMCQFHQKAIVRRYITNNPKLEASKELKKVMQKLTQTDKVSFTEWLRLWHEKWNSFLKERTINPETKRWNYTHNRLRSAYRSLKNNLPYLFTWEDHFDLKIPNTTNSLEGTFSNLKTKLRVHNGLVKKRKVRVINSLLLR